MSKPTVFILLFLLATLIVACVPGDPLSTATPSVIVTTEIEPPPSDAAPSDAAPESLNSTGQAYAPITLPISVYIIDDEDGRSSSARSVEELATIYERVNDIWSQAGIVIDPRSIQRITLPAEIVEAIVAGELQPFLDGAGRELDIPQPSLLNAFYAQEIGGPNGIAPFGVRLFFVMDEPSVHDERVSSHEIGHILGLHHTLADQGRLLFPGTNGQALTDEEIVVARYAAQGLLDRQR